MSASGQSQYYIYLRFMFLSLGIILLNSGIAIAQPVKLSIRETIERVQRNLPQLESYRQQSLAAEQNILLAKNSIIPDLTAGYQANMATVNNITGMSYPGFLLPISGPPSISNEMSFVPGTALGALVKWNPFTFGQRNAAIEKATAQYSHANAIFNQRLFEYQFTAINIYLEALYLKQAKNISEAGMERYRTGLEQSLVLAINGLIPGIDTAQFQSAIIQAEIESLQTEKAYLRKLTELARLTDVTSTAGDIVLTDTTFKALMVAADSFSVNSHPNYQSIEARKNITAAGLREIQHSWVPQLDIWGNAYARGSGVSANGTIDKADGWKLSRTNAGVGLQLSFPILGFSKVNIRKKQYNSLLKSDDAELAQARLDITKQVEDAELQYRQDVKIAVKTPVQLKIATNVYKGLRVSYEAGLIDYARLYQAQYELTRAELNNATAQLQLWRSLLSIAVAKGDLASFLDQLN